MCDDITEPGRQKQEMLFVMESWEKCFEALPQEQRERSLGRFKWDVVFDFIQELIEAKAINDEVEHLYVTKQYNDYFSAKELINHLVRKGHDARSN